MADEPLSVQSSIRRMLVLLIRAALTPDLLATRWQNEALGLHRDIVAIGSRLGHDVHLDALWQWAVAEAETSDILSEAKEISTTLPMDCPLTLSELMGPDLHLMAAVQQIRNSAATG